MTSEKLTMIVRRIAVEYHRAIVSGEAPAQAEQTAFLAVSAEFAGERVYIAGLPKAQRARQIAKLKRDSTRNMAVALGVTQRRIQQLMK
jgi:hypothetical protein